MSNTTLLMMHITTKHGEEPCKKFAANKCTFGHRCSFKHILRTVNNVPNNSQGASSQQAPKVFQNSPATGQHLMVGQQEKIMYQMNQLLTQLMRNMNI